MAMRDTFEWRRSEKFWIGFRAPAGIGNHYIIGCGWWALWCF